MHETANGQRGFTMTELLTSVALAAITTSLAVPGMKSLMRESQQTMAANQLVGSMHGARSAALTRNTSVTLCTSRSGVDCQNVAWEDGWIVFADDNADGQRQAEETLLETSAGNAGVTIRGGNPAGAMTFDGGGRITGLPEGTGSLRLTICDARGPGHARVLAVNAIGKPRAHPAHDIAPKTRCPGVG